MSSGAARPGSGGPHRAALDALLGDPASPQSVVHELLGKRQLWWQCCSEAVRTDPAWLRSERAGRLATWIDETAPERPSDTLTPALHAYLVARALSAPESGAAGRDDALARVRSAWASSGLLSAQAAPGPVQPSGRGVDGLPADTRERLNACLERISRLPSGEGERTAAPDGALMTAVLLMAGCATRRRPLVRVPVVFDETDPDDDAAPGATGILELREFPAGPPGLYPDPRAMTGLRSSDGQFATALGRAWVAAGPGRGSRCVLWRLVMADRPAPLRIEGPSLGVAFALGLRELLRHPRTRRPSAAWVRGVFYGLRPRTAVTGALGNGERLIGVSGMEGKLLAARRKGLRLVAPAANRSDAAHAPEPTDVRFAGTLRQADRYARRFRVARLVTALSLVAAAVTSGVIVEHRESEARERLAAAHRLAGVSEGLLRTDVGLAGLFAERAYREHADPLTRRALLRAVTESPHLVGSVRASGTISAVASSGGGGHALVGTKGGEVERWALGRGRFGHHERLGRLPGPVKSVASDTNGDTVAAIDRRTVKVWDDERTAAVPRLPGAQRPTALAVSPTGRFVAVATTASELDVPPTLAVLDLSSGRTRQQKLEGLPSDVSALAFDGDAELVAIEYSNGTWNRISRERLTRTAGNSLNFGAHNVVSALAPDGGHISFSNKDSTLPVWPSRGEPDAFKPKLEAETEPGLATAMAVSGGGSHVATAIAATLQVSRTHAAGGKASDPLVLAGAGTVDRNTLTFVGPGGDRLASASHDLLSLWDLNQRSRIARTTEIGIPASCLACQEPRVSVSPDGRDAAVLDSQGTRLSTLRLGVPATAERQRKMPRVLKLPGFAELLWRPDSERLIVVAPDGSAQILARGREWRPVGVWPALPNPLRLSDPPMLMRFLPGGQKVAEVHASGTVRFRDAGSGKVLREVRGPNSMAPTASAPSELSRSYAAVDDRATHTAVLNRTDMLDNDGVRIHVTDTASGRIRTRHLPDALGIAYADDHLLVQRGSGALEVWTASGSRRLGRVEGADDPAVGPVTGGGLVAGTTSEDHTVRLLDLRSGSTLGSLPLPEGNKAESTGLVFSADGTKLVTATEGDYSRTDDPEPDGPALNEMGQLIEWRIDPRVWIRTVCSTTGKDLQPADWEQHMGTEPPSSLRCGE
ncbi:hypothetical protein [Streptomyces flavofungini]|uniref:hypothetical protein n=1 Tax=Streptomyces flavofungini TaxID=68200 RepID=UPI0034DE5128